eukprot:TRINITY_DN5235_c0_g1_i2.p1 TRINITY_DN5235_c0_g1~~TRINITY_DN5235_c0_g1_i2.p1  ORF type:complete len:378 (-),score=58.71 TRINITY_DN5235_c0_g1_i2:281-1414(-)
MAEEIDRCLTKEELPEVIRRIVQDTYCVDLHTHLFPPSHGNLMLWGIDELLTYHYLIAEYFSLAKREPLYTPDQFFKLSKEKQADTIWQELFIKRSPLSEACKGVLSTLKILGLDEAIRKRDLKIARDFFASQKPEEYLTHVFKLSKVKYAVMTNIPFNREEAEHWIPKKKPIPPELKSALRVDPLLTGEWDIVETVLQQSGYPTTLEGARSYLRDWAKLIDPVYFMASTPAGFMYPVPESLSAKDNNKPSGADLLEKVLLPLAEELNLGLALKIGAERNVNPALKGGGDGVVISDVGIIKRLCTKYPKVKFLVTYLSRVNQHEVAVIAQKFSNLHLYGCWWYCNNPSIIKEITTMRFELLGLNIQCPNLRKLVLVY